MSAIKAAVFGTGMRFVRPTLLGTEKSRRGFRAAVDFPGRATRRNLLARAKARSQLAILCRSESRIGSVTCQLFPHTSPLEIRSDGVSKKIAELLERRPIEMEDVYTTDKDGDGRPDNL